MLVATGLLLVAAAGCSQARQPPEADGRATTTAGAPTQPASASEPYELYTHCGIRWAKIRGTFWYPETELSDGSGNPPKGWGNPYQSGRLTFQSARTATFTSPAGQVVFHWSADTNPPLICS